MSGSGCGWLGAESTLNSDDISLIVCARQTSHFVTTSDPEELNFELILWQRYAGLATIIPIGEWRAAARSSEFLFWVLMK
jgi:hypothetical protein